jgi:putative NADPH-quinone reductase
MLALTRSRSFVIHFARAPPETFREGEPPREPSANAGSDGAETAVWDKIQELAVRFQQADRIVLGVPMWNFAYPYKLKFLAEAYRRQGGPYTGGGRHDVGREREGRRENRAWSS